MNQELIMLESPKSFREVEIPELDHLKVKLAELLAMGYKPGEVAEELGRSVAWVRLNKKDQQVIKLINDLQSEALDSARKKIIDNTIEAADTIVNLMGSEDERISLAAAKDLLDRAGIKDKDQIVLGNTYNFNFSEMSVEDLKIAIVTRMKNLELDG